MKFPNVYRDSNSDLRCQHHRKLHIACPDCEAEQHAVPEALAELVFWVRFLLVVGAAGAGAVGVLWYYS